MTPTLSYLVCATPRSGSTLLCQALGDTGIAGCPEEYFEALRATGRPRRAHEYFEGVRRPWVDRLASGGAEHSQPPGDEEWRRQLGRVLEECTTPNGVFGAKMMWGYLEDFATRARGLPGAADLPLPSLLGFVFPGLRYVWVTRRDKVRQAVSLWRAIQTQSWRAGSGEGAPEPEARYEFEAIDHLVGQLEEHDAQWRLFFAGSSPTPLELAYEEIAADLPAAVHGTLRHLGLDPGRARPADAGGMRRQADELSERWVAAYREQRQR